MMSRFEGFLLIPHELLHLAGYKLMGKQCRYQWGDHWVTPVGPIARRERLVGLLFPFVTCLLLGLVLLGMAGLAFYAEPVNRGVWSLLLTLLASLALLYAGASLGDLRQAYFLIFAGRKTPFDLLFWPVTTDHGRGLQLSAVVLLVICLMLLYGSLR